MASWQDEAWKAYDDLDGVVDCFETRNQVFDLVWSQIERR